MVVNSRQQIGITRSSKPILQPLNSDKTNLAEIFFDYTLEDHFDSYALFQYLLSWELAKMGWDSPWLEPYDFISDFHSKTMGDLAINSQKRALGLATIFDVIEFGKTRADPIFV